jgi:hypothetical protein
MVIERIIAGATLDRSTPRGAANHRIQNAVDVFAQAYVS